MINVNVISVDPSRDLPGAVPAFKQMISRSRENRILSIVKQSKEHGFSVRFWEGIEATPIRAGISKAHKQIVAYAKENNLPEVCIMEDDCVLSAQGAFDYFLKNKPNEYDLYLGGIYSAQLFGNRILNGFSGMTLYFIKDTFYDFFLSAKEDDDIDRWLGNHAFEKNYFVCVPYVCYQIGEYSDNLRKKPDYSGFYKDVKFYGGVSL